MRQLIEKVIKNFIDKSNVDNHAQYGKENAQGSFGKQIKKNPEEEVFMMKTLEPLTNSTINQRTNELSTAAVIFNN